MLLNKYNWTGLSNNEVPQLLSSWGNHYNSWKKFPKNYLLIRYEDLVLDIKKEILKLINYLSGYFEYKITDKLIEEIGRNTSFENFKKLEIELLFF